MRMVLRAAVGMTFQTILVPQVLSGVCDEQMFGS